MSHGVGGRSRSTWTWALLAVSLCVGALVAWQLYRDPRPPTPTRSGPPAAPPPKRVARPLAQLRIATEPAGARIVLDGSSTERLTPDFFTLDAGREHSLRLELEGHESQEVALRLEPGEVREIRIVLVLDGAP